MIAAAALVVASSALASEAKASRFLKTGIFDDAQVLYGTPEEVFPLLKTTRSRLVRVNVWWFGPGISVAKHKPKRAADPADPAYDWTTYDRTVRYAVANGMQPVFSIIGTPPWANAARGWNVAPTNASAPAGLRDGRGHPLLGQLHRAPTATCFRASRAGSRGTSRTTPCSCVRSTFVPAAGG